MPLRGNVGFRQVETSLYAEGYSSTGGGTKVFGTHKYENTLPSLNLALDVTDDLHGALRCGENDGASADRQQPGRHQLPGADDVAGTQAVRTSPPASATSISIRSGQTPTTSASSGISRRSRCCRWRCSRRTSIQLHPDHPPGPGVPGADGSEPGRLRGGLLCTLARRARRRPGVPADQRREHRRRPADGFRESATRQPFTFLPAALRTGSGFRLNYTQVKSEIDYCDTTVNALCTDLHHRRPGQPLALGLQRHPLL
jgi:iron complex outermembrane receptor protein